MSLHSSTPTYIYVKRDFVKIAEYISRMQCFKNSRLDAYTRGQVRGYQEE